MTKVLDDIEQNQLIVCRGEIAKQSANYTPELCEASWDSVAGVLLVPYISKKRERYCSVTGGLVQGTPSLLQTAHEEVFLPCMITKSVPTNSKEAKSSPAIAAVKKELEGHTRRGAWDLTSVREHYNLVTDPNIEEFMLGRGFGIMGIKNAELSPEEMIWKYRAVFQGSAKQIRAFLPWSCSKK